MPTYAFLSPLSYLLLALEVPTTRMSQRGHFSLFLHYTKLGQVLLLFF